MERQVVVLYDLLLSLILFVCAVTAKNSSHDHYLSYGALDPKSVPCNIPGISYSNCRKNANPYDPGCTKGQRCRYGGQYSSSSPPPTSSSSPATDKSPPPPSSPSTDTDKSPPPSPSTAKDESPPPPSSPSPAKDESPPPPYSLSSPPPPVSVEPPPSPLPTSPPLIPPPTSLTSPPPPVITVPLIPPSIPPTLTSTVPPPVTLRPPSVHSNSSPTSRRLIVVISVAVVLTALLLSTLVFFLNKKRQKSHNEFYEEGNGEHPRSSSYHVVNVVASSSPTSSGSIPVSSSDTTGGSIQSADTGHHQHNTLHDSLLSNCTVFTYEDLAVATNGFADSNLIGEGGFGYVHRGVLLPEGREIAVKQLKSDSGQGDLEFQAEVDIISRVHHRNLVSLVGYCIAGDKRLLVYDFVSNKTLYYHLHEKEDVGMNWETRFKVALSSAKGLAYLHEDCHPKIIHRDIKASNILLDSKFNAQVSDFGLAKFFSETNTHITTRVMGTFGYLAPEYASSGKLTDKSDVFSFGILLLEIITGLRPTAKIVNFEHDCIVDWARPSLAEAMRTGKYDAIVDERLHDYDSKQMKRMVACAAASIRHLARLRPGMGQIVRVLEGGVSIDELNHGVSPGHSVVLEPHDKSITTKTKPTMSVHDFDENGENGSSGNVSKILKDFAMKLGLTCGR